MKFSGYEIYAFVLGAALGSLVTYFRSTREIRLKALKARIRSDVRRLNAYHGLAPRAWRKADTCGDDFVTDTEILEFYRWANKKIWELKKFAQEPIKLHPERLTAEIIICEKLLGLTAEDALSALTNAKTFDDVVKILKAKTGNDPQCWSDAREQAILDACEDEEVRKLMCALHANDPEKLTEMTQPAKVREIREWLASRRAGPRS